MNFKKAYFAAKDERGMYFVSNVQRSGLLVKEALVTTEKNARKRLGNKNGEVVSIELVEVPIVCKGANK